MDEMFLYLKVNLSANHFTVYEETNTNIKLIIIIIIFNKYRWY